MEFSELASFFQKLEHTSSRLAITEILSYLFKKATDREIGPICYMTQGRVVPMYEAIEFGLADKFMFRSIALAYYAPNEKVASVFKKTGDMGLTAQECYRGFSGRMSVLDVFESLKRIALMSGTGSQDKKIAGMAELLQRLDRLSVRFLVRIPLDKLRMGFSEMTILDALSYMVAGDKTIRVRLEDAYNMRPDIGYIATQVKKHGVKGVSHVETVVGAPILAALCQRIPNADVMIKKMGEVAVEPKYDGVRVQIHYQIPKTKSQIPIVKSFSRNLENTTAMFPELLNIGKQLEAKEVILDCEAVGFDPKNGNILPFQETTQRKRKHQVDLFAQEVPIRFYVFDILFKNGKNLLSEPLSARRKILEKTIRKGAILEISPQIITSEANKIRAYHDEQIKKGLEGAVVKKWHAPYEPGRRGYTWVKFKEEEGTTGKLTDTIDCVVMGFYRGEGKRSGFGIGAFLVGIRKDDTFVTISKIGTGVSDELWKKLKVRFEKIKTTKIPKQYTNVAQNLVPDVWIDPNVVVEVAGDDLTKSPNHGAGIAIRFPRLVRVRDDKGPLDVTTVEEVQKMYDNQ